jgi:hypothetical protein
MDNCDLFSEEARKSLTKYKVYKAKPDALSKDPQLVWKVKTSSDIASESDFNVKSQKEMPIDLEDDEVVATAMDLYLTINLTENLKNAKM